MLSGGTNPCLQKDLHAEITERVELKYATNQHGGTPYFFRMAKRLSPSPPILPKAWSVLRGNGAALTDNKNAMGMIALAYALGIAEGHIIFEKDTLTNKMLLGFIPDFIGRQSKNK